jgi:tetratricopeptide (TPR) repeat protein
MRAPYPIALVLLCSALSGAPAGAITGDDAPPPPGDRAHDAYAAGLAAFAAEDWQTVIERMAQVIAVPPGHADAHNRTGFAKRNLGDNDRALAFYDKAHDIKPNHRGAIEYICEKKLYI